MSSKAIFQQFSVARPAGDSSGFSLVGPKFAIMFLMVFISVFSLGALLAISSIEASDLHLIVQLLYHFWLLGIFSFLIVGWLFGIALLLGQERLIFSSGYLIVRKDLFWTRVQHVFYCRLDNGLRLSRRQPNTFSVRCSLRRPAQTCSLRFSPMKKRLKR